MKILQSYWSKPYLQSQSNSTFGGWSDKAFHYMSCALSCLKLSEFYPVELVTDNRGKKIFIDELGLPFASVKVELESMDCPTEFWALAKIVAYSLQEEPFIHVDNDIFIWDFFPERIIEAGLIAQNKEDGFSYNSIFLNDVAKFLEYIPETIHLQQDEKNDTTSSNAGIFGGNDLAFFKEYTHEAFLFVEKNREHLHKLEFKTGFNLIFEQYLFHCLAQNRNKEIAYYFENTLTYQYKGLVNFWEAPENRSYIHALASYKKHYVIGEQIAQRLWFEYPDYFYRIQHLIEKNIL